VARLFCKDVRRDRELSHAGIQGRIGEGTRVTVRLPFEGASGDSTDDLIKFIPERGRGNAITANIQVKESA
jgi:hypothetical protein